MAAARALDDQTRALETPAERLHILVHRLSIGPAAAALAILRSATITRRRDYLRTTLNDVFRLPLLPQLTVIGQRPEFVVEPTRHDQVIFVPVFAPRPSALETVVS